MSAGEVLVRADGVGKKFCRDLRRSLWYGLKDLGAELFAASGGVRRGKLRPHEFWALQDVSFELRRGECLGLIGRNGAGKTTLLRILNGLIKPDRGRVEVRGRTGALIALGAGFSPILTGRENIYVSGAVLGLGKRDIDRRLDEIIDFSGLEEFIDAPVQSYSSGMTVRLGFAVASTLEPDVLFLDEVLAVGDAGFRHKCYRRVHQLMQHAAVVLVTHSMEHIALVANRVALLRKGEASWFENCAEGVAAYLGEMADAPGAGHDGGAVVHWYPPIQSVALAILGGGAAYGRELVVEVDIESSETIDDVLFSFTAVNAFEQEVMCWNTTRTNARVGLAPGRQRLRFRIDPLHLHDGTYTWNFNAVRRGSLEHFIYMMRAGTFVVSSPYGPIGHIPYLPSASEFEVMTMSPSTTSRGRDIEPHG